MTDETREDNIMFDLEQLMEHGMPAFEVKAPAPAVTVLADPVPPKVETPIGLPVKNIRIAAEGYTVVLQNGSIINFKISESDVFHRSVSNGLYFAR